MLDIIDILNWATRPVHSTQEYRDLSQKATPYWNQIEETLPGKFADELAEIEDQIAELVSSEHFERGLWLGLRLGQFAEQGPRGGIRNP